jgi:hypothetical protein
VPKKKKLLHKTYCKMLRINLEESKQGKYYESIRHINHGFQPRTNLCQGKLGNLLTGHSEVLNRWKEYLEEQLNSNVTRNLEASGNITYRPELEISEPTN